MCDFVLTTAMCAHFITNRDEIASVLTGAQRVAGNKSSDAIDLTGEQRKAGITRTDKYTTGDGEIYYRCTFVDCHPLEFAYVRPHDGERGRAMQRTLANGCTIVVFCDLRHEYVKYQSVLTEICCTK